MLCPCCGGEFDRFLPLGRVRRENARCPGCGSLERHRLACLFLQREGLSQRAGLSILHVAPEPALRRILSQLPRVRYVSIDREPREIGVVMDLTQLAFPADVFDLVMCSHVLEHVPEDRRAMREIRRVLKPGGRAILQVPLQFELATTLEDLSITDPATRERLYGQPDHVRLYGRDYLDRLAESGFMVHVDHLFEEVGEEVRSTCGLVDETFVVCT
jgi:SAM-dependent methyltransferase